MGHSDRAAPQQSLPARAASWRRSPCCAPVAPALPHAPTYRASQPFCRRRPRSHPADRLADAQPKLRLIRLVDENTHLDACAAHSADESDLRFFRRGRQGWRRVAGFWRLRDDRSRRTARGGKEGALGECAPAEQPRVDCAGSATGSMLRRNRPRRVHVSIARRLVMLQALGPAPARRRRQRNKRRQAWKQE